MNKQSSQNLKEATHNAIDLTVQIDDPFSPSNLDEKNSEVGGPSGLEPTRYGDWERKGRCIDF